MENPPTDSAQASAERTGQYAVASHNAADNTGTPSAVDVSMAMTGYCCQFISPELNNAVADMLQRLRILQDHALCFKPFKGEPQRWYVRGLREVRKAARQQRAKSIVMAPNIEQVEVKGGPLSTTVAGILSTCKEHDIPVVFALSRKKMGDVYGCHKRMSAIAIIDTTGIEDLHTHILQLAADLRKEWEEQYQLLKQGQEQQSGSSTPFVFTPTPLMLYTQSLMLDDACSNSSGSPSYRAASDDVGSQGPFSMRMPGEGCSRDSRLSQQLSSEHAQSVRLQRTARPTGTVVRHDMWPRRAPALVAPPLMAHPSAQHVAMARAQPMLEWHYSPRPHATPAMWSTAVHPQIVHQAMHAPSGAPVHSPSLQQAPPAVDVDACLANLSGLTLEGSGSCVPGVQVRFEGWPEAASSMPIMHSVMEHPRSITGGKIGYASATEWQGQGVGRKYWQGSGRHYQANSQMPHSRTPQMAEGYGIAVPQAMVPMHAADAGRLHASVGPGMMSPAPMTTAYYALPHAHPGMPMPSSAMPPDHMVGISEYVVEQWPEGHPPSSGVRQHHGTTMMMASGAAPGHEQVVYLVPPHD